ncbi:MAG TPA: M48 family metalloprotease [archaeon]|nr:M48 family metalloprotease [archaeon]
MITECVAGLGVEYAKLLLVILSLSISASLILLLKMFSMSTKAKIVVIYSHLSTLLFPLVLLTTNIGCASVCAACYTDVSQLMGLAIPTTFLVSTLAGFVAIPAVFVYSNRKREIKSGKIFQFVKNSSTGLKIKQPKIYTINTSKPVAFSFRNFKSAVFLSVGMFDILKWKEVQAVVLHELAHIKQKSSALKLSTFFLRIFSPISILLRFHHTNTEEERKADAVAAKIQKTDRYIKSARNKIAEYEKEFYG